ncbi:MAG: putative Permease of the drug/metabolite transporter superfamily [Sphingomonas bacterium]|nr:putative Permease of the drug/metabolite transporter superfamily [Sphingomonas bacterium]MDB5718829.1 putative Permease of the drug/metabolite transporter superfamily [Sphingomonas bacterium]
MSTQPPQPGAASRAGSQAASPAASPAGGQAADSVRSGVLLGASAYLIWGLLPLFLRLLAGVAPAQIVAHRVLWSLALLATIALIGGRFGGLAAAVRRPRVLPFLCATATLIAINWLIYAWAVLNHHVIETSLGYFINPLLSVVLGVVILKERLRPAQMVAVGAAAIGVAIMAVGQGAALWISLGLALSFGGYGLLRKMAPVDAFDGLTIESALLAPFAVALLLWASQAGQNAWGESMSRDMLLIASGPITAAPLILFAAAAKRMRLATLGLLQYIAPTLQFLQGWLLFGERLTTTHLVTFGFIWLGLALYAVDGVRTARAVPPMMPD